MQALLLKDRLTDLNQTRRLMGQYGTYDFRLHANPVSQDLQFLALAFDQTNQRWCVLLHHPDSENLKFVQTLLDEYNSPLNQYLKFVERFKIVENKLAPEYFVVLEILLGQHGPYTEM